MNLAGLIFVQWGSKMRSIEREMRFAKMNTARIEKVIAGMHDLGISQLLVSSPASVFYLTGKWIQPGERMLAFLVKENGECCLYANRLFALSGNVEVPLVEFDDTEDCVAVLAAGLTDGKIGIDKFWPSQFTIRLMEQRRAIVPVVGSSAVDLARLYKDEDEIRRMVESSRKNDETIEAVIAGLHPGMSEMDGAELYTREATAKGATGMSFDPLICYGPNCAEPHHSSDRVTRLKAGDSVIIDVGLVWQDYCSDMTRTVFLGEPTDEQKRVYELVRKANEAGRAAVRPGVPVCEVDRAARQVIEDAGYGKYFIHRTGHGIGLECHEYPDVSRTGTAVCRPGMCFSVEPGIYLPGKFGVRIEDLVCVTEDGAQVLNAVSRELRCIEG